MVDNGREPDDQRIGTIINFIFNKDTNKTPKMDPSYHWGGVIEFAYANLISTMTQSYQKELSNYYIVTRLFTI